jgi:uncharacterized 2Fe-2S/4Fe-4S cluster protein (DUF4445 family)
MKGILLGIVEGLDGTPSLGMKVGDSAIIAMSVEAGINLHTQITLLLDILTNGEFTTYGEEDDEVEGGGYLQ